MNSWENFQIVYLLRHELRIEQPINDGILLDIVVGHLELLSLLVVNIVIIVIVLVIKVVKV